MTRIDILRIVGGIVLIAGSLVWASLVESTLTFIAQGILFFLGITLLGLGLRHWWISRR